MTCKKCSLLMELFKRTPGTNRDYWLMTELFVLLHGSDVCDKAQPMKYGMANDTKDDSPSKRGCL